MAYIRATMLWHKYSKQGRHHSRVHSHQYTNRHNYSLEKVAFEKSSRRSNIVIFVKSLQSTRTFRVMWLGIMGIDCDFFSCWHVRCTIGRKLVQRFVPMIFICGFRKCFRNFLGCWFCYRGHSKNLEESGRFNFAFDADNKKRSHSSRAKMNSGYDFYGAGNRYSPQYSYSQQMLPMMMPMQSTETYSPLLQAAPLVAPSYQAVHPTTYVAPPVVSPPVVAPVAAPVQQLVSYPQQPRVQMVTLQKNVQVPKTVLVSNSIGQYFISSDARLVFQVQESKEITTSKPKYEYENKTLMIPQTITRSRVIYETKMIPVQVFPTAMYVLSSKRSHTLPSGQENCHRPEDNRSGARDSNPCSSKAEADSDCPAHEDRHGKRRGPAFSPKQHPLHSRRHATKATRGIDSRTFGGSRLLSAVYKSCAITRRVAAGAGGVRGASDRGGPPDRAGPSQRDHRRDCPGTPPRILHPHGRCSPGRALGPRHCNP